MTRLQPKQFNIAHGPQGQRWDDSMTKADDRWRSVSVREHGRAYAEDVTKTHIAAEEGKTANTSYYPGQGGPGTQVQGKLFHDPKPVDPHRWPRGYTPERQSDVDVSFEGWAKGYASNQGQEDAVVARAKDTIARSDMPERDLRRVSKGFEDPIRINADRPNSGGTYHAKDRLISLSPDAPDTTTMHEVGHAMSAAKGLDGTVGEKRLTQNWHAATWRGGRTFAEVAGAEEARADIYARHTRQKDGTPDLRNSDYNPSDSYLRMMNSDGSDSEHVFRREYAAEHERQGVPTPSAAARQAKDAQDRQAWQAANPPKPSPHLFQRPDMSSSGYEETFIPMPTEPDFGQYGAVTPEGKDIGTIPVSGGLPAPIQDSVLRRQRMIERVRGTK